MVRHAVAWEHWLEPIDGGRTRLIVRGRASSHWLDLARAPTPAGHHRIFIERVYAVLATLPRPLLIAFAGVGHRMMEARHLRGIRRRSTGEHQSWRATRTMAQAAAHLRDSGRRPLRRDDPACRHPLGQLQHGGSNDQRAVRDRRADAAALDGARDDLLRADDGVRLAVWKSAPNRALRIVGALLFTQTVFGVFWPPMHQRAVLAAGGGTMTDTLHIVWTVVTSVFFMVALGFGAAALGKRFRVYSLATMAIVFACGAWTGTYAPAIQADMPTPWVGVWERINTNVFMLWVVVVATTLLRIGTSRERGYPG